MPELIDKQKVQTGIALIAKYLAKSDKQKAIIGRILFMIDQMPTIKAEPVRHGRCNQMIPNLWRCTECKSLFDRPDYNFCPACGAKMDGGADNA